MAERIIGSIIYLLPMAFALGFLAPVIMALMNALGIAAPWGMETFPFALGVAGLWGAIATISGRWL